MLDLLDLLDLLLGLLGGRQGVLIAKNDALFLFVFVWALSSALVIGAAAISIGVFVEIEEDACMCRERKRPAACLGVRSIARARSIGFRSTVLRLDLVGIWVVVCEVTC